MNRVEKRQYIRNIKGRKGLQRKRAKGAFGRPPDYEMEDRKAKWQKMTRNVCENILKNDVQPQYMVDKTTNDHNISEIPDKEKWLYSNENALSSVKQGLKDAKEGNIKKLDKEELIKEYVSHGRKILNIDSEGIKIIKPKEEDE